MRSRRPLSPSHVLGYGSFACEHHQARSSRACEVAELAIAIAGVEECAKSYFGASLRSD